MNTYSIVWRFWASLALGVLFYLGLKYTVKRLPETQYPILLTLASFWTRTVTVVAAFLFMMRERWEYAVICLAGFTVGRAAVMKFFNQQEARPKCT